LTALIRALPARRICRLSPYTTLFRSSSTPVAGAGAIETRRAAERGADCARAAGQALRTYSLCIFAGRLPYGLFHPIVRRFLGDQDRKSTRLNFSHGSTSYAVLSFKKN